MLVSCNKKNIFFIWQKQENCHVSFNAHLSFSVPLFLVSDEINSGLSQFDLWWNVHSTSPGKKEKKENIFLGATIQAQGYVKNTSQSGQYGEPGSLLQSTATWTEYRVSGSESSTFSSGIRLWQGCLSALPVCNIHGPNIKAQPSSGGCPVRWH